MVKIKKGDFVEVEYTEGNYNTLHTIKKTEDKEKKLMEDNTTIVNDVIAAIGDNEIGMMDLVKLLVERELMRRVQKNLLIQ